MGHDADRFNVMDGVSKMKYFLNTGGSEPFGRKYLASLVLAKNKSVTYT